MYKAVNRSNQNTGEYKYEHLQKRGGKVNNDSNGVRKDGVA